MQKRRRPVKQTQSDRHATKKIWRTLSTAQRLQYLFDYYRLPILGICIVLYILGYTAFRHFAHTDTLLYTALVNVSAGETLTGQLTDGYLDHIKADPNRSSCTLYSGWYLTDDPSSDVYAYTQATRMKVLASIDSEQLDVVLMNREAFDAFAQNGYLCNLEILLKEDPILYGRIQPFLSDNIEILEDNAEDLLLDPSLTYEATTAEYAMAVDLSNCGVLGDAGFSDSIYFGIIGNSPRMQEAVSYLQYLMMPGSKGLNPHGLTHK